MAYVDLKSEGINPPLYKVSESAVPDVSGTTWSLLYANENNPDPNDLVNPVNCFLYPSNDFQMWVPGSANTLNSSNVPSDNYMIFKNSFNSPDPSFTYNDTTVTPYFSSNTQSGQTNTTRLLVAFKTNNGSVEVWQGYFWSYATPQPPYGGSGGQWTKVATVSTVTVNTTQQTLNYCKRSTLPSDMSTNAGLSSNSTVTLTSSPIQQAVYGKTHIDKTDAKNIKLINLPYCPTPISVDANNVLSIGNEWWYINHVLQLKDLNTKLKNIITTSLPSPIYEMVTNTYHVTLDGTGGRSGGDPKLYHSDYYYRKFVYDSFSKIFRCECLDWDTSMRQNKDNPYFYFDFITSRNIVSKFLFMFPQYTAGNKGLEDYDNILPIARNNEEVLYNSQYLNYLRTGYNYDLKTKERNTAAGAAGIGISLATLIGSIALTATGYGAGIGVAGIVGSVAGLAGSAISLAKTTAQAEENIQRKLQESQNQAVSVSSADDYDLLEAYSGNMAKMCTYEVSTQMRNALDDMFYYSGYVVNEQYKPSVDVRYWFDFLQADLVITWTQNL